MRRCYDRKPLIAAERKRDGAALARAPSVFSLSHGILSRLCARKFVNPKKTETPHIGAFGRNLRHDIQGSMVGTTELESVTSCMSSKRSNLLSYAPMDNGYHTKKSRACQAFCTVYARIFCRRCEFFRKTPKNFPNPLELPAVPYYNRDDQPKRSTHRGE